MLIAPPPEVSLGLTMVVHVLNMHFSTVKYVSSDFALLWRLSAAPLSTEEIEVNAQEVIV